MVYSCCGEFVETVNDIVIKIGELLVRAGIVTGVDLSEAEKLAKHMNLQFGQVLIMSGCLSEHDLDCALVAQQLIREELLTVDVACQALAMASQNQMPFEDALEALSVVPKYGAASVEMAELLADAAIIPGELLEQALMTSLTTNVSLGELLVRENAISSSLIPVLNVMLADIGTGSLKQEHAITEIRKNHYNWQRALQSGGSIAPVAPPARTQEPSPVFVSQELMHAYEIYQPKSQPQQPLQQQQAQPLQQQQAQPLQQQQQQAQPLQHQQSQPLPHQQSQPLPYQQSQPLPHQQSRPLPQHQPPQEQSQQHHSQQSQPSLPSLPQVPPYNIPAQGQPQLRPQSPIGQPTSTPYPEAQPTLEPTTPAAPHSIHDVLSMFQQRNPVSESSTQAVPRDQQAASWSAFVQSQSFDPNDVEPSTPPISVAADEPRSRHPEEVVQGTYAKTFDGKKSSDLLPETFEQPVPDFEPAAELIAVEEKATTVTSRAAEPALEQSEVEEEPGNDEQFSLLVELLIESTYFDREDIIEAVTNALKEESKASKLLELLNLVDGKAIIAASICADAMRGDELTSGEAVSVLSDIKNGAEIHEALESVNLELAVTVSANLQMIYDDEIDETFYVGDVSRTIDIFEPDDFAEEALGGSKKESLVSPHVVQAKDDTPPIAFGYGRDRLKISKRSEPIVEEVTEPARSSQSPPVVQPAVPPSVKSSAQERPQTVIGGKKVSSLSEVFEQLSGVESHNTLTPIPASQPSVSPNPFTPVSAQAPTAQPKPTQPAVPAAEAKPEYGQPPSFASPSPEHAAAMPATSPDVVSESCQAPVVQPESVLPAQTLARSGSVNDGVSVAAPVPGVSAGTATASEGGSAPETVANSASDDDKKALRKRNSTTFNSLQAVFVPPADQLGTTAAEELSGKSRSDSAPEVVESEPVSSEASSHYAAYVSGKSVDESGDEAKVEVELIVADPSQAERLDSIANSGLDASEFVSSEVQSTEQDLVKDVDEHESVPETSNVTEPESASHEELNKHEQDAAEPVSTELASPEPEKAKDESAQPAAMSKDADVGSLVSQSDKNESEESAEINEEEEPVASSSSKKKPRSSKAKVRGGAKDGAPAPKKPKRRK